MQTTNKPLRWHIGRTESGQYCLYRWVYGQTYSLQHSFKTKRTAKAYAEYMMLNVVSEVV